MCLLCHETQHRRWLAFRQESNQSGYSKPKLLSTGIWWKEFGLLAFIFRAKGIFLDIWEVLLTHLLIPNEPKSSLPLYPISIFLTLTGNSTKHTGAPYTGTQIRLNSHLHPLPATKWNICSNLHFRVLYFTSPAQSHISLAHRWV